MAITPTPGQSNTPGEILKRAREAKKIELRTVHESTKIPMDVLHAIEEGYTVRTLSPFYLKGFLKMYASYLGVDLKGFDISSGPSQPPAGQYPTPEVKERIIQKSRDQLREMQKSQERKGPDLLRQSPAPQLSKISPALKPRKPLKSYWTPIVQMRILQGVAVLLAVFAMVRVVGCLRKSVEKEEKPAVKVEEVKKQDKPSEVSKPKVEVRAKKDVAPLASAAKPATKDAKPKIPAPVKEEETQQKEIAAPSAVEAKKEPPKEVQPPQPEKVVLKIKSKKTGWLQVKMDGKIVFQSTIREGAEEKWQANDSLELSGKNIHYLEYELNGKNLGTLKNADPTARRVMVNKNGLEVMP